MNVFSLIKFNYLNRLSYRVFVYILSCLTKDIIFNIFLTRIVFDDRWNLLDYFDIVFVHYRLSFLPFPSWQIEIYIYINCTNLHLIYFLLVFFSICYTLFIYLLKQSRIFLSLYWYKIFCSKKIYRRKLTFNLIYRYKIWIRDLFFPVDIFPTNEPYYAILLLCVFSSPSISQQEVHGDGSESSPRTEITRKNEHAQ